MSLLNDTEIPIGLGMALMQNTKAMNYFSSLEEPQKKEIIEQTHQIQSKREMEHFVSSLSDQIH